MLTSRQLAAYISRGMEDIPGTLKKGAALLWERNVDCREALSVTTRRIIAGFFQTTDFCNASCIMCGAKFMLRKREIMPLAIYRRAVEQLAEAKAQSVLLSAFGEPLLDPYMIERILIASRMKAFDIIGFTTNGSMLNGVMYERLAEAGLKMMAISIDGFEKESYEKIRKGLSYEKLERNIHEVLKVHEAMGRPIVLDVSSFTRERKDKLRRSPLYQRLLENGIAPILKWRVDNWAGLVKEAGEGLFMLRSQSPAGPCAMLYDGSLLILPDGSVTPCNCRDLEGSLFIGHLRNESLSAIWRGDLLEQLRGQQERNQLRSPCGQCSAYMTIKDYFTRSFVKEILLYDRRVPWAGTEIETMTGKNRGKGR